MDGDSRGAKTGWLEPWRGFEKQLKRLRSPELSSTKESQPKPIPTRVVVASRNSGNLVGKDSTHGGPKTYALAVGGGDMGKRERTSGTLPAPQPEM